MRKLRLDPSFAAREFRDLPPQAKRRIRDALRSLAKDPTGIENGLNVRCLDVGPVQQIVWRLRVGDWRIVFFVDVKAVRVMRIIHRREGYDWVDRWLHSMDID